VFNKGRIEQLAAPRELYTKPRTEFVARFVGSANVATAALAQRLGVERPFAIRGENITVQAENLPASSGAATAAGAVVAVQYHGAVSRWQVQLDGGDVWSALVSEDEARTLNGLAIGSRVRLSWPREAAVALVS
jgi:putative spermidine/putrescine transport system ATP-binding protein